VGEVRSTTSGSPSTRTPRWTGCASGWWPRREIGEIQRLGGEWSLFFRDPDGMELEVCAHAAPDDAVG